MSVRVLYFGSASLLFGLLFERDGLLESSFRETVVLDLKLVGLVGFLVARVFSAPKVPDWESLIFLEALNTLNWDLIDSRNGEPFPSFGS